MKGKYEFNTELVFEDEAMSENSGDYPHIKSGKSYIAYPYGSIDKLIAESGRQCLIKIISNLQVEPVLSKSAKEKKLSLDEICYVINDTEFSFSSHPFKYKKPATINIEPKHPLQLVRFKATEKEKNTPIILGTTNYPIILVEKGHYNSENVTATGVGFLYNSDYYGWLHFEFLVPNYQQQE